MSDWRVLDLGRTGSDRTHHNLARVYANPNLDRCAPFGLELRAIASQFLLHPQCGVECALRMVLMRDGRAEQREDAIAGRLHDVAVVAAYRLDHQLQRGIDDRAGFFGIEILLQFRRAFDIREQRGDCFALALGNFTARRFRTNPERRLRSLNARCWQLDLSRRGKRGATVAAELPDGFVFSAALRAAGLERTTTFAAE